MEKSLTIIVFEDAEKEPKMTERFFYGITELNADALDDIQVIAISQTDGENLANIFDKYKCNFYEDSFTCHFEHPQAENGYPIWNVMEEAESIWDRVCGDYVTFSHMEFFNGPGHLKRTVNWLKSMKPVIALGNLRRIGIDQTHWKDRLSDPVGGLMDVFKNWVDRKDTDIIRSSWDSLPTTRWTWWKNSPNELCWAEDVFYIRKDFFDCLDFFNQEDRLAYQDIYDMWHVAWYLLDHLNIAPPVHRMDRQTNELIHIDHKRTREAFSLYCYKWFLENREQWLDTTYANDDLWSIILSPSSTPRQRHEAIGNFRRAPGGTVARWQSNFLSWLQGEGAEIVRNYLKAYSGQHMAYSENKKTKSAQSALICG